LVLGLSRQPCGATKTSAPNRASSRTSAERIPDKGVNRSDNPAYSRVQPVRTSWPSPNRESPMNESHKAPADHPAPHPNDSSAGALFTFVHGGPHYRQAFIKYSRAPALQTFPTGFWGFYRIDENTPYRESVNGRKVRHDIDPRIEAAVRRVFPAFLEDGCSADFLPRLSE
jgi:hypothetical protein